jgi:hypothetical protein
MLLWTHGRLYSATKDSNRVFNDKKILWNIHVVLHYFQHILAVVVGFIMTAYIVLWLYSPFCYIHPSVISTLLLGLVFELRALHFQSRFSTTWAIFPVHFALVILEKGFWLLGWLQTVILLISARITGGILHLRKRLEESKH